jgi:hypothetical protein
VNPVRDRCWTAPSSSPTTRFPASGCGDGLIAFGALDRLGPGGNAQLRPLVEAGASKDGLAFGYLKASGIARHLH